MYGAARDVHEGALADASLFPIDVPDTLALQEQHGDRVPVVAVEGLAMAQRAHVMARVAVAPELAPLKAKYSVELLCDPN